MALTPTDSAINDDASVSEESDGDSELSLKSGWTKLKEILKAITIEPMLLLQMIALSSCMVNVQNYYIQAICFQEYNNETLCEKLTDYDTEEKHVDAIASLYATYRGVIEAGLPIIFSLFLGSWSDKHGSKIPMIIPLVGYTMSAALYAAFSFVPNINPGMLLIASVPVALSGGLIALIMSAFRYIADITTVENRSFRIAMAEGCWFLGSPFGLLGSTQLYKYGGFQAVFLVAMVLYALSLLYTIFWVRNDRPLTEPQTDSSMLEDMFDIAQLKDTVRTCFRKRVGNRRFWIILLLLTICFRIMALTGGFSTTYLYTRSKFHWSYEEYSTYSTVDGLIGLTGSGLAVLFLMKIWKVSDETIGLLSGISALGGALVAFSSSFMSTSDGWMMYLAGTTQMFCGLISIVIRSMISKLVAKDEIGKIYSFLASGEATMPLLSAPLYNFVFMKTNSTFPGGIHTLSLLFNGLITLSFIYFFIVLRKVNVNHRELEEDPTESRA